MFKLLIAAVAAASLASASPANIKEGIQGYVPAAETAAAKERFRDDKFGVFIHWGVCLPEGSG